MLLAGDPHRGLGAGGVGLLASLPVSFRLADRLAAPSNLGLREPRAAEVTPRAESPAPEGDAVAVR